MNEVSISKLAPDEPVLMREKVASWLDRLTRGEQLPPIQVFEVNDYWVVRDGNHRVRAYVEYWLANGRPAQEIPCEITSKPTPDNLEEIRQVSSYCGVGQRAFASLPIVPQDQVDSKRVEEYRKIRAHNPRDYI